MDPVAVITQIIQSLGVILILGGMLIAFLWKAAAIINTIFGLIITFIATYFVYSLTSNLVGTGIVFFVGLVATAVIAALGALTCILEGFILSAFGFWGAFVAGSPSSVFSSGSIIGAVVASVMSTGFAVFVGGRVLSTKSPSGRKNYSSSSYNGKSRVPVSEKPYVGKPAPVIVQVSPEKPKPVKVEVLPKKSFSDQIDNFPRITTPVDKQAYFVNREKIEKQIVKLVKEVEKGRIRAETANKLRGELENQLMYIDSDFAGSLRGEIDDLNQEAVEVDAEVVKSRNRVDLLERDRKSILAQHNELEARFRINQIAKKEFVVEKKMYEQRIGQINSESGINTIRIQKLTDRRKEIEIALKNEKAELDSFADKGATHIS
jgi:hypothetical protein